MSELEKHNESSAEAYLRMCLDLFLLRESLWMTIEDSKNDYVKIKACKESADIIFKEFEYARNIGYYNHYNKLRNVWNLLREYTGPDMKVVIEKFIEKSDDINDIL